jgi:hypothetical protein
MCERDDPLESDTSALGVEQAVHDADMSFIALFRVAGDGSVLSPWATGSSSAPGCRA